MQRLVLNLHFSRLKGGGMKDVGVCCPQQGSRESQLPAPLPRCPSPLCSCARSLGIGAALGYG